MNATAIIEFDRTRGGKTRSTRNCNPTTFRATRRVIISNFRDARVGNGGIVKSTEGCRILP